MKSKTVFSIVLFAVASCLSIQAQTVSPEAARAKALDFFNNGAKNLPTENGVRRAAPRVRNVELAYTSEKDGKTCFYVYNNGENGGFVIVGGDEVAKEILAYVPQGHFDYEKAPDNVKWWLGEYDNQIEKANTNKTSYIISSSDNSLPTINPLLRTKWGQNYPYNKYCPVSWTSEKTPTGCVATAMAQIIRYHEYPMKGRGYHEYEWMNVQTPTILAVDYNQSVYDYAAMTDATFDLTGNGAEHQMSKLMFDCGVSVNMDYDMAGSGASIFPVPDALVTYFQYDNHTVLLDRGCFNESAWTQLVYNELANGRPVFYAGSNAVLSGGNTVDNIGHAFVCDGYQDGYFHFNFGWNGNGDGFFKLNAICNNELDYNIGQYAVLIYPNSESQEPYPYAFDISYFTFPRTTYGREETLTAIINGSNLYHAPQTIQIGYRVENMSTGDIDIIQSARTYTISGNQSLQINDAGVEGNRFANGIYKLSLIYYDSNGNIVSRNTDRFSYTMSVSENSITLVANPNQDTPAQLEISSIDAPKAFYQGHGVKVNAYIKNAGNREFFGSLCLYELSATGTPQSYDVVNTHIPANDSVFVSLRKYQTTHGRLSDEAGQITAHFAIGTTAGDILSDTINVSVQTCPDNLINVDGLYFKLLNDNEACLTYNLADQYTMTIDIPSSITYNGQMYTVTALEDWTLCESIMFGPHTSAYNLSQIVIPSSVTDFGCQGLQSDVNVVVAWPDPSQIRGSFIFPPTPPNTTLTVPVGLIDVYMYSEAWKRFRVFTDGETTKSPRSVEFDVHGGGTIEVYLDDELYQVHSCDRGYTTINVPDSSSVRIKFVPSYSNQLLEIKRYENNGYISIINMVNNDELLLTDSVLCLGLSFELYFGFVDNNVYYSAISTKEVIVLPYLGSSQGGYRYEIPEILEHNNYTYSVGNFAMNALWGVDSITVPWNVPLDVWQYGISSGFERTVLNVPQGSFDLYANHSLWGKFSKIAENGVLRRDFMSATYVTTGLSEEPYTLFNGQKISKWQTFNLNKNEDIDILFYDDPYSWFKLSKFEVLGKNFLPEVEGNHYLLPWERIDEYLNDHTGGVTHDDLTFFIEYSIEQDGIWFTPHNMWREQRNYFETDQIDTIYTYDILAITQGVYSGEVIIPDTIKLIGDSIIPFTPILGKTRYRNSSCSPVHIIGQQMLPMSNCTGLKSIEVPSTINWIQREALVDDHYNYLIVNWESPDEVSLEDYALYAYNGYSEEEAIANYWSYNKNLHLNTATLMVPAGSLDAYKQHPQWGKFEHIVEYHDWHTYEQSYPDGDTNFDGVINDDDLSSMTTNLLGLDRINSTRADINGDGVVDVADCVLEVNIFFDENLNNTPARAPQRFTRSNTTSNLLDAQVDVTISGSDVIISTNVIGGFSAFQFYVTIPDSMEMTSIEPAFAVSDHQFLWSCPKDSTYRFVCMSPTNAEINNLNGQLMSFSLANRCNRSMGNIKVSNIKLVDNEGIGYSISDYHTVPLITFVNYDGTSLQSTNVEKGRMPVYNGPTPRKPATSQYTYTFVGWDKAIVPVAGTDMYVAQYDSIIRDYRITYLVNGEVLKSEKLNCRSLIELPKVPEKDGYIFYLWEGVPDDMTMPEHDITINAKFVIIGDVNIDERVDVTDAVDIINDRLGFESTGFVRALSDVNKDQLYTVADAIGVINIMYGEPVGRLAAPRTVQSQGKSYLDLNLSNNNTLAVNMNCTDSYSAFQFDIELPMGIDLEDISMNSDRCQGFAVQYNRVKDNRYTVVAYNFANESLKAGSGNLLLMTLSGSNVSDEVKLSNIHFSTCMATDVSFKDMTLSLTATGILNKVNDSQNDRDVYYNINGQRILTPANGIYIRNGEKVINQK